MKVAKTVFGRIEEGTVYRYVLENAAGNRISITNYGARLVGVEVSDRNGIRDDILLGYDTFSEYQTDPIYCGATCGRFGNRIGKAFFEIGQKRYDLDANDGRNHLHGGKFGFDKRLWQETDAVPEGCSGADSFRLHYRSPDGEEGYPGELLLETRFSWSDENELDIRMEASTDQTTFLNPVQHPYFNLAGHGTKVIPTIDEHLLTIFADSYTEANDESIPTGVISPVAGTALDFRTSRCPGECPYNTNFVIRGFGAYRPMALLNEPKSGRAMEIIGTPPGIHLYSGDFISAGLRGKQATVYGPRCGLALESQFYPDSPHHPSFPSTLLEPNTLFQSRTTYRFYTT